jgi:hypothetical protein
LLSSVFNSAVEPYRHPVQGEPGAGPGLPVLRASIKRV